MGKWGPQAKARPWHGRASARYHHPMILLLTYLGLVVALAVGVAMLHLIPRMGQPGRQLAEAMTHAPLLDLVIAKLTVGPWVAALIVGLIFHDGFGWAMLYLLIAVLAQYTVLLGWCRLHELAHRQVMAGPRMVKSLNRAVGPWRNYAAVYWTAWAVPLFNIVRLAEYCVYPPVTWLIGLPKYQHRDWVRVSRHKFTGLVGSDRIWCLYCDWMTGVWSLGSEMLRNIESFWCPIRFQSELKCDNCKLDFPDIDGGWVPADATIADAAAKLEEMYPGPGGVNAWYGHPSRVTVEGRMQTEPERSTDGTG